MGHSATAPTAPGATATTATGRRASGAGRQDRFARPGTTLYARQDHRSRLCLPADHDHVRYARNVASAGKQSWRAPERGHGKAEIPVACAACEAGVAGGGEDLHGQLARGGVRARLGEDPCGVRCL